MSWEIEKSKKELQSVLLLFFRELSHSQVFDPSPMLEIEPGASCTGPWEACTETRAASPPLKTIAFLIFEIGFPQIIQTDLKVTL